MAKYLSAVYRGAVYGNPPRLIYNAEPMEASAIDYGKLSVYWNSPSGNFTKIRLVRNNDNFPETEEDGVILWEQASTTSLSGLVSRNSFVDGEDNFTDGITSNDLPVTPGQFIYYTIWLFTNNSVWIPAGYASALMPENRGSQKTLFEILPKVYTSLEQSPTGIPNPNSFIYNFLQGFSFTFDQTLTYAELVKPSYGRRKTPPTLLPALENSLGLTPERGIPYRNQKKLIREAIYLYQTKGTLTGIQNYIEALSGYNPTVTISPNLMLDTQDSSFTKSIGRWTRTYGTLTAVSNKPGPTGTNAIDTVWSGRMVTAVSVVTFKSRLNNVATLTTGAAHGLIAGDSVAVTGVDSSFNGNVSVVSVPTPTTFTYANTDVNVTQVAATGSVSNTSSMSLGRDNPVKNGIPVNASTSYKFTYHAASDSNGSLVAQIFWFDYLGAQIGGAVEGTVYGTTGVYQRIEQTATSPATAVYAGLRIIFRNQNSYNIDMVQFGEAAKVSTFDEARAFDVFLEPRKVNIIANPSFETNTDNWTTNSSKTRVADVPAGLPGAYSMRLSGQNSLAVSANANKVPTTYKLTEGQSYTFSCYLKASAAASVNVNITAVDDNGPGSVTATTVAALTTVWKRYYVSLFVPEGLSVSGNITLSVGLTGTLTGQNVFIDAVQVEQSFTPTDYFDGSLPQDVGVFWSGTAHASYSYYYVNRLSKMPRIILTLKDWVPYNAPYRIRSFKGLEGTSDTVI
jgi:hypothetical protein